MHLFLATQGINHQTELWKKFMETQMFEWKRKNLKTGEIETSLVQGALRPIQLWTYVFPKESLGDVLGALHLTDEHLKIGSEGIGMSLLRKALGIKKCPLCVNREYKRYIMDTGMDVRVVGIKEDEVKDFPQFGYNQEAL